MPRMSRMGMRCLQDCFYNPSATSASETCSSRDKYIAHASRIGGPSAVKWCRFNVRHAPHHVGRSTTRGSGGSCCGNRFHTYVGARGTRGRRLGGLDFGKNAVRCSVWCNVLWMRARPLPSLSFSLRGAPSHRAPSPLLFFHGHLDASFGSLVAPSLATEVAHTTPPPVDHLPFIIK